MKYLPRILCGLVVAFFFLPWTDLGSTRDRFEEKVNEAEKMLEAGSELIKMFGVEEAKTQVDSLKKQAMAQVEKIRKMDQASGYYMASTNMPEVGAIPAFYLIPALAVLTALINRRKWYIIYPFLAGFGIFINWPFNDAVRYGSGLSLTWFILIALVGAGLAMPKEISSDAVNDPDDSSPEQEDEEGESTVTKSVDTNETEAREDQDEAGEKDKNSKP